MGSMDGKICLVTGGSSGIGYYTAREIARMGAVVIILGRNELKCIAAVEAIQRETGNPTVEYLLADLSSQAQIREAARQFYDHHDCLDVLVNNAGGFFLRRRLTVDGFEMTFALNHLAYFLLTNLLITALKASSSARVVSVSSGAHYKRQLDFDDLQLVKFYNPMQAYGRTKLANLLFSYELARRLEGTHVTSNALTPGMVATDIWKKVNPWITPLINPVVQRVAKPPLEGAQTSIYLATSPEVEGVTGKYYADKQVVRSSAASYDLDTAKRLWEVSLQLVGLTDSGVDSRA
jgi:NAD(P)-dependent dehydrogenase (short-subunit alcohol dehydrogenase family)